jgi:hypothetical protein
MRSQAATTGNKTYRTDTYQKKNLIFFHGC